MSPEFLITALVICATPGTGVLYTLAAALARGARAGLLAAVAGTLGTIPHMLAAITGAAAILHASGVAFEILKIAGVAYLLYMAWATWRDRSELVIEPGAAAPGTRRVLVSGILVNLLNPKLTLFFFAFLPQFVPAGTSHATLHMLALSGVFMAITLVVFAVYAAFAAALRRHVIERPAVVRWMRRVFAGSFLALGAKLAVTER